MWEQVDDEGLLAHLPRIEAVRELSWDRFGAALGRKRQSAWERFAG